jgi:hypothetical protein
LPVDQRAGEKGEGDTQGGRQGEKIYAVPDHIRKQITARPCCNRHGSKLQTYGTTRVSANMHDGMLAQKCSILSERQDTKLCVCFFARGREGRREGREREREGEGNVRWREGERNARQPKLVRWQ